MKSIFNWRVISSLLLLIIVLYCFSVTTESDPVVASEAKSKYPSSQEIEKSLLPSIVETIGAASPQYHIIEHENTYTSKTPNHDLDTTFYKDGVMFERGQNNIRMNLITEDKNVTPELVSTNRIEYKRGNITEWYVNSHYGIEQGFTLQNRPKTNTGNVKISLNLEMSDGVKPVDHGTGKTIQFVDSSDKHILDYGRLYAFDSRGKELPSHITLGENNTIHINVDDRKAKYPIIIDPFVESQRVTAADPTSGSGDDFGFSVSIDGDNAIVGIPGWDGVVGINAGAVVIYERNVSGVWVEKQTLFSRIPNSNEDFGTSVSISGDWAMVGEPDDGDFSASGKGTVHFYRKIGSTWSYSQTVSNTTDTESELFGTSVSISGDRAIVGDPRYGSSGDNFQKGAVFVYERSGLFWSPVSINPITASDGVRGAEFGTSVSISGDWFIVGAPGDNSNEFLGGTFWGAVYFFQKAGTNWTERQKVIGTADSEFGASVDIEGNIAVAGAFGEEVSGIGFNTGAVYVFERNGTDWTLGSANPDVTTTETRIGASDPRATDEYGMSVAIDGSRVIVGATRQDIGESGAPGSISNAGSIYIYERIGAGNWGNEQQIFATDPNTGAEFGRSVSMSGDTIFVGAPGANDVAAAQGAGYFLIPGALLTIEKESNPDAATAFGFIGSGFPANCGLDGSFTLDDNDSAGTSFIDCDLAPGSYTIQESDPNGYELKDINCVGTTNFAETSDSVTVNLVEDDIVVCTFTNALEYTLTLTFVGLPESGTITSAPGGINCGADCSNLYEANTQVALSADVNVGFLFDGWSGDADCSDGNVTMNQDINCIATFSEDLRNLDVTVVGNGAVTSTPAGIDCGSTCSASFRYSNPVMLTPTPEIGYMFDGWSGVHADCTDGVLNMKGNRNCTATFIEEQKTLTLTVVGGGRVTSDPVGINCGTQCVASFGVGQPVVLTPIPNSGFLFDGWSGVHADCNDGALNMRGNRVCTATFIEIPNPRTLTVTVAGNGTVTSVPSGIDCGSDCSEIYPRGTPVTLTPIPDSGFVFDGWSGVHADCTDGVLNMLGNRKCTATFISIQNPRTLTVTVVGTGTVTTSPTGVDCGSDCSEIFERGTPVTMIATPGSGYMFDGWSGVHADCTDGVLNMNGNRNCTATFIPVPNPRTLTVTVVGGGTVTTSPTGIDCGDVCSWIFERTTPVTMIPTPEPGFVFDGWSGVHGDCTDGVLNMNGNRNCTATFVGN